VPMRKSSLYLLVFSLMTAGHGASAASDGDSPLRFPLPTIDCEYFLSNALMSESAREWLADSIAATLQPAEVTLEPLVESGALSALGLPSTLPDDVKMFVDRPRPGTQVYWVRLVTVKGELARFPFPLPPVYIWRNSEDFEPGADFRAALDEAPAEMLAVGTSLGEFDHGRLFMSVRRSSPQSMTVLLGVDLYGGELANFTSGIVPHFVVIRGQEEPLQRIDVIKAEFKVRHAPPRRPLRGGPGRIT
jgi:hypothetical protein